MSRSSDQPVQTSVFVRLAELLRFQQALGGAVLRRETGKALREALATFEQASVSAGETPHAASPQAATSQSHSAASEQPPSPRGASRRESARTRSDVESNGRAGSSSPVHGGRRDTESSKVKSKEPQSVLPPVSLFRSPTTGRLLWEPDPDADAGQNVEAETPSGSPSKSEAPEAESRAGDPGGESQPAGRLPTNGSRAPGAERAGERATASPANARESLEDIRASIGDCRRCGLCESRTNIVFGVGDPNARLMFIGEAPGYHEDLRAEPYVGKAGQLLDKMIEAMGLSRQQVYIANVIKCRPPDNRNPLAEEIAECAPFLKRQIRAVDPEVIVALGKFASTFVLGDEVRITRERGQWQQAFDCDVMPTFHPSYLLRKPEAKRFAWQDLQAVMAKLGLDAERR